MAEFGTPHRHFSRTDSTNTRARELAEAGAPHGTVVTAGEQREGRGRQGRVWTAPAGKGLLYSAVLRPLDERHLLLPLSVPIAVCEAAESLRPDIECQIKWRVAHSADETLVTEAEAVDLVHAVLGVQAQDDRADHVVQPGAETSARDDPACEHRWIEKQRSPWPG